MGLIKKCIEAIKCKCACAYNDDFCPEKFNSQIETIKEYKIDFDSAKKLSLILNKLSKKGNEHN
tara:strand:+ start:271 stop:462 length:192 start_codon:yes stop_codon:yes gene_type:complete